MLQGNILEVTNTTETNMNMYAKRFLKRICKEDCKITFARAYITYVISKYVNILRKIENMEVNYIAKNILVNSQCGKYSHMLEEPKKIYIGQRIGMIVKFRNAKYAMQLRIASVQNILG
jgi:antitoxin component YwqK of YwqJK toxin-antitoxin module